MHQFTVARLQQVAKQHPTPFWVYDAECIRARIAQLRSFDTVRFAQKACSNLHILRLMREQGVKIDAVSHGEIVRALAAGYSCANDPSDIVFTADLIDATTLAAVHEHQIPVNAGSIDMLRQLGRASKGHPVWLRINPGFGHGHSNKTNTGGEHSKHGIWHADLPEALAVIREQGLRLVGLHMHIGSGVDYAHLAQVGEAMLAQVKIVKAAGMDMTSVSAGGGLSIPYREGDSEVDTAHYFQLWDATRKQAEDIIGHALELELEPGRFLVAQAGCLVSEVRATKQAGKNHFVLIDAGFNELMRPSMYGSYHRISLLAENAGQRDVVDSVVAGPLCESGDVFTQGEGGLVLPRSLPQVEVGELLVIHDTGAYGASMSSNYNSRPLIAEVLLDGDKDVLIRRAQRIEELLALEAV
ncbi:diaminopimelate decarboxylase [Pseudomonas sp. R5(2019)]|uniref:diaminopimelate decarboxylase n=1 Tax=Pseudomonas sp. R5(2019) TaxID=2697566 RepID=UPI0014130D50|nr:diaminopimelate decarboxylase [Pseudomonas sp. R5(2019)]NBA96089.1 diaminopimelate decarboxylase [Pseudomonas sp. R5(2019)]